MGEEGGEGGLRKKSCYQLAFHEHILCAEHPGSLDLRAAHWTLALACKLLSPGPQANWLSFLGPRFSPVDMDR